MYLFVPCDKKSHGTEISFPIRSNRLSHPHPLRREQLGRISFILIMSQIQQVALGEFVVTSADFFDIMT